jgi:hypothetical protein
MKRTVVAIAVILGSSLVGLAPLANATSISYYNDCGAKAVIKPANITEYCADAGAGVIKIKWSTWKATTATGTGTFYINGCVPYCGRGIIYKTKVAVTLSGLTKTHGKNYLMRVRVVPTGNKRFVWPPKMKPIPGNVTWLTDLWRG